MLVNTQWTIQLSHKHRSILCCSALEGFRSWLLLWNVIRDLEPFANPAIPHFVPPAHVGVVIAKTKSIWGNTRVGASTSVFRIFKAYCFERGCKSRFGWSFLLRFFPKEKHNTGEESKRAKRTKQRTKKYKEHRMHQRRRNNDWKHTKMGDKMELVRLVKCSRKQIPQRSWDDHQMAISKSAKEVKIASRASAHGFF